MKEYIERKSALQELRDLPVLLDAETVQRAIEAVHRVKPIYLPDDPENMGPRDTAEWEWDKNACDWNLGGWICSKCRSRNDNIHADLSNTWKGNPYLWAGSTFCPNCGRRMIPKTKGTPAPWKVDTSCNHVSEAKNENEEV